MQVDSTVSTFKPILSTFAYLFPPGFGVVEEHIWQSPWSGPHGCRLSWWTRTLLGDWSDVEKVKDPLMWWYERCDRFPRLSHMARDYLTIPGKWYSSKFDYNLIFFSASTVDIERIFSQGRLVLSHICNHLSIQSTHACMCVSAWSLLGLIKDSDIWAALREEVTGGVENDLAGEWSVIDGPK